MTDEDHVELLETLKAHQGPVLISGYDSDIYNTSLRGWNRAETTAMAQTATKRREVLWMNFEVNEQIKLLDCI